MHNRGLVETFLKSEGTGLPEEYLTFLLDEDIILLVNEAELGLFATYSTNWHSFVTSD
jgi:hypothetical protein